MEHDNPSEFCVCTHVYIYVGVHYKYLLILFNLLMQTFGNSL